MLGVNIVQTKGININMKYFILIPENTLNVYTEKFQMSVKQVHHSGLVNSLTERNVNAFQQLIFVFYCNQSSMQK